MKHQLKNPFVLRRPAYFIPLSLSLLQHTHTSSSKKHTTHTHRVINTEASHANRTRSRCWRAAILQEKEKTPVLSNYKQLPTGKSTTNENHYQLQDRPDTAALRFNGAAAPLKQKEITCMLNRRTHMHTPDRRRSVCHPPSFHLFV